MQLPKQMLKSIPKEYFVKETGTMKLLWEEEWRALGITQVRGCFVSRRRLTVAESRLGTLRGARARAAHPALQVGSPYRIDRLLTCQAPAQLPTPDPLAAALALRFDGRPNNEGAETMTFTLAFQSRRGIIILLQDAVHAA